MVLWEILIMWVIMIISIEEREQKDDHAQDAEV